MKTAAADPSGTAAIVQLLDLPAAAAQPPADASQLERARAFAEPLLQGRALDTGEDAFAHAAGVAAILQGLGASREMQAAAYLVYAGDFLSQPEEIVAKAFGASHASLVTATRKLVAIQRAARAGYAPQLGGPKGAEQAPGRPKPASSPSGGRTPQGGGLGGSDQTERVRKMLLAFSRDLRVVLLRLASRLQTLRWFAASRQPCPQPLAQESLQVFAPLANRLGIWQVKWELEDLAFRFLQPEDYRAIARLQGETRVARERQVEAFRRRLAEALQAQGIRAEVQGRPKHLYSIWKKMQGKGLAFDDVYDVRALRVIVETLPDCYAALSCVHELLTAVAGEFDDYIARPKPNGYQSLHTVVQGADGRPIEVQIRTRAMHEHAEHGVAAHWAYKEAGARGYAGVSAGGSFDLQVAEARKAVLRQLLAWERDAVAAEQGDAPFDDRIYVFTPQAAVVELPAGATPIDFAYLLHTDLGHRCRGARVDGAMHALNKPLQSGQTVEIVAAKEGGPSLDWLNAEQGYLRSPRSRAKVRAWFNALAQQATIARGREAVEKVLQRAGKTALKLDDLAQQLGFRNADALFEVVGKDEFSLRSVENLLRPAEVLPTPDELIAQRRAREPSSASSGGVLVVGVESLLTSLARCCRPAPPDAIAGYVTRGRGVAIHRASCSNFRQMAERSPERVIAVAWGSMGALYPVDVIVEAADRQGLLRDVTEVFAKQKINVSGVNTRTTADALGGTAWMTFTVEVDDAVRLAEVLARVAKVGGVRSVRRR
ncbi:MAG: bifunctional (p)ppGpp synthetase/guanosine-3',5'-bis(diphosphate) 3'-pyrophosphohydrolase [Piscinibacter sp.]|nr:bifunctional (p)ppGpp synthetase/guanosine-3',5'-bis(diphosphate) 3'-pyrophosphohydrolase [Piscinibacter sp.]